jgi:hypothetical protein
MSTLHRVRCVLVARGCYHRAGVSSRGGVLVVWGCTRRVGVELVELSCGGGIVARGCTGLTGLFSSCGGDVAVVAPVRLVAPC